MDQYLLHYPLWDQFLMGQHVGNIKYVVSWASLSFIQWASKQETKDESFDVFASLILTDDSQVTTDLIYESSY